MDKQFREDGFIPKHGGYQNLLTYRKADIIYLGTQIFLQKTHQQIRPNVRSDGASFPFGYAKHSGGKYGIGNIERNRNKAYKCCKGLARGTEERLSELH